MPPKLPRGTLLSRTPHFWLQTHNDPAYTVSTVSSDRYVLVLSGAASIPSIPYTSLTQRHIKMSSTEDVAPSSPAISDCSFSSLFGEEPVFHQLPKLTLPVSRPPTPPSSERDAGNPQGIMLAEPADLTNEQWGDMLAPLRSWCQQMEADPPMCLDPAKLMLSSSADESLFTNAESSTASVTPEHPETASELSSAQGASQGSQEPSQASGDNTALSAGSSEPPTSHDTVSPTKKGRSRAPPPRRSRQHLGRDACTQCKESKVKCVRPGGAGPGQPCIQCAKRGRSCQTGKDNRTNRDVRQDLLVLVSRFKEAVTDLLSVTLYFKQGLVGNNALTLSRAELLETHTPRQLLAVLESMSEWERQPAPHFPAFCDEAVACAQEGTKLAHTRAAMERFSARAVEHLEDMHVLMELTAGRILLPEHIDRDRVFSATSTQVSTSGTIAEGLFPLLASLGVGVHLLPPKSLETLEVNYTGNFRAHAGKKSIQQEHQAPVPAPAQAQAPAQAPGAVVSQGTALVRPAPAMERTPQRVKPSEATYSPRFSAPPPKHGVAFQPLGPYSAPAPPNNGFRGYMGTPQWGMGHMAHDVSHAGAWVPANYITPPNPNVFFSPELGMVVSLPYPPPPEYIERR